MGLLAVYWPGMAQDIYENARKTKMIFIFTPVACLQLVAAVIWLYFDCMKTEERAEES